jgi:methylase of polypeptide subunit release factors
VYAREHIGRRSIEDILGWNRPFSAEQVAQDDLERLADAGVLEKVEARFRSTVRFSTLGQQLFVHSSFPTDQPAAVFFGPDTYRFARLIDSSLATFRLRSAHGGLRILDVGAGSGAGGLHAAVRTANFLPSVTLADINPRALRFCAINAVLNAVPDVSIVESNLFERIPGVFDLIIANPPYLIDPLARTYRHGGGALGFELSLRFVTEGLSRLAPGGRLLLYTGSAIVNGSDRFREALVSELAGRDVGLSYEEIDPDVFGEELDHAPYGRADRLAVVGVTIDVDKEP